MTAGELRGFKLIGAGLVIPLCIAVPWALFGDVVPDALKAFFGPRALGQLVVAVVLLTAALAGRGVFILIREAKASADPKAARRKLLLLVLGSAIVSSVISASVFAYYASQHQEAGRICAGAEGKAIPLQRQALKDAEPARSKVRFFNEDAFACWQLEQALESLDKGSCPRLVPPDARCRCGAQRFPTDSPVEGAVKCINETPDGTYQEQPTLQPR